MSPARFDVLGIGNAIVDVVAAAEDDFLSRHTMRKGAMRLISAEAAEALYAAMPPGQESSGGSAANTCAVASGLARASRSWARSPTISWGRCFATTSPPPGYTTPPSRCMAPRRRPAA